MFDVQIKNKILLTTLFEIENTHQEDAETVVEEVGEGVKKRG